MNRDSNILIIIGEAIKKRRLELGYTQIQLSEKTHVHRNFISYVEQGKRSTTITTLNQILEALDTDIFTFMGALSK